MSPKPITDNTLFYGDNQPILRERVTTEILAASEKALGTVRDVGHHLGATWSIS